jgi:hypothetical protein
VPTKQKGVHEVFDPVEEGVDAVDVGGDLPVLPDEDLLDHLVEDAGAAGLRSFLHGCSFRR